MELGGGPSGLLGRQRPGGGVNHQSSIQNARNGRADGDSRFALEAWRAGLVVAFDDRCAHRRGRGVAFQTDSVDATRPVCALAVVSALRAPARYAMWERLPTLAIGEAVDAASAGIADAPAAARCGAVRGALDADPA